MKIVKIKGILIFIVGYVMKEGLIVGLRLLEYMVDIVLYFEGECYYMFCILWVVKNCFGFINEMGIFEMCEEGFIEVLNFLEIFLEECLVGFVGLSIIVFMEGIRLIFVEIQVFILLISFGNLWCMVIGIDYNRVLLLMVVLEKRVGLLL